MIYLGAVGCFVGAYYGLVSVTSLFRPDAGIFRIGGRTMYAERHGPVSVSFQICDSCLQFGSIDAAEHVLFDGPIALPM
jgi:hypothetical protein